MSNHLSNNPPKTTTDNATVHPSPQPTRSESAYRLSHTTTTKSYPVPDAEYEEITQNAEIFLEKLQGFHRSFGTKFKVPIIGGTGLDLYRLFVEVTSRGGIEKVITDRKWKEVIVIFNFPSTITSASFVLRKYYLSLLYHFEQVYYFRKKVHSMLATDSVSGIVNGSTALPVHEDSATMNQFSGQESSHLEPGCSVTGTIDAKFDNGYLITVDFGSEKLKGVLYHTPLGLHISQSSNPFAAPPHRNRKRYQLALRDPSRPKPNRSGYNLFFADQYAMLKPLYQGQEKAISNKIGLLWSRLTEDEKRVYQDKGLRLERQGERQD